MPLLAGVLSSLVASGITAVIFRAVARFRVRRRSNYQHTSVMVGDNVQGDKVYGDKITNLRYEHHDHHHVQRGRPALSRATGSADDSEGLSLLIGTGVATVFAVLAFLLVWQYVLGLMIGTAIVLVGSAGWLTVQTKGCPWCRNRKRSLWLNTIVGLTAGVLTWGFVLRDRTDNRGLPGALAKVSDRYPTFGEGVEGRWAVLTTHWSDILGLLGANGVFLIAFNMLAIAAIWVIALLAIYDAYALTTAHWESGPPVPSRGAGQTFATLLLAALAITLVVGPAEKLLDHQPRVAPQPSPTPDPRHTKGNQ